MHSGDLKCQPHSIVLPIRKGLQKVILLELVPDVKKIINKKDNILPIGKHVFQIMYKFVSLNTRANSSGASKISLLQSIIFIQNEKYRIEV